MFWLLACVCHVLIVSCHTPPGLCLVFRSISSVDFFTFRQNSGDAPWSMELTVVTLSWTHADWLCVCCSSDMLKYGCTRLEIGVQSVYEDVARDTNRWVSAWVVQRDWCTECVWGRCPRYQQVSECMGCTQRLVYRVCMRTLPEIPTGEWVSAWVVQRDWYTECVWGRCPRYQQVSVLYREIGIQSVYEDIAQDTNRWVHCPERLVYSVCEDISYY